MISLLSEMEPGQRAIVEKVEETANRDRLHELGFLPGTAIRMVRRAPLQDPIQISLRGFDLTLRRSEAAAIKVRVEA